MDTNIQNIQNAQDMRKSLIIDEHEVKRMNSPIISFEALSFIIGIAVSLLSVVQNLDENGEGSMKNFALFLVGSSVSGLGLTLVGRILFGIEIKRNDKNFYATVEWLVVFLSLLALMFAVPFTCVSIDNAFGGAVWIVGILLMIPVGFAYIYAFDASKKK